MALPQDQIAELKLSFPDLALIEDGNVEFILIKNLTLPVGCNPRVVDALLCPTQRDGYPSRLFLAQKIEHLGKGINWNADGVVIADRKWWAVSWQTHRTEQRLLNMVTSHLEAFRA